MELKWFDKLMSEMRFKELKKWVRPNRILDIGCGDGMMLRKLNDNNFCVGLDKDLTSVKESSFHVLKYKIDKSLPFSDNSFDTIILSAAIEHLENPKEVMKECHRILRKNGRVIITTPKKKVDKIIRFMSILGGTYDYKHENYFDDKDLKSLLRYFKIIHNSSFQLGMNQIIIGERINGQR